MMTAVADVARAAAAATERDRRIHERLDPGELGWIREVRLKYGPRVQLLDLSSGGALLQTSVRLKPNTDAVIEIVGSSIEAIPIRVLRSQLARISGDAAIYQGACEFKRPLDLAKAAEAAGAVERGDVALRKLVLRRRDDAKRRRPASAPDLPRLLRSIQQGAQLDDPFSRGLRELLSDLLPFLDRGEPGAVVKAQLEDRLRRAMPNVGIAIGSVPAEARPGTETIYFAAAGADAGVINVEMPEGSCVPDWQFKLLQAGGYLLELLPLAAGSQGAAEAPAVPDGGGLVISPATPDATGWQKIVVRYREGRLLKGFTHDFHPSRTQFTLWPAVHSAPSERMHVPTSQLKAVFFVRDFAGNPGYSEPRTFDGAVAGRRLEVTFADDEVLLGSTLSYRPDGLGFFINPADTRGNNLRVFVVGSAIRHVRFL